MYSDETAFDICANWQLFLIDRNNRDFINFMIALRTKNKQDLNRQWLMK